MTAARFLPGPLPEGERLLWQGTPDWRLVARRVLHVRKLALYFAVIVAWVALASADAGAGAASRAVLRATGLAALPLAGILLYAWAIGRSTAYTLTDKRLVLSTGLALPLSINIPFSRVAAAAVCAHPDGSGDLSLALSGTDRLAYLVLWPHARPWRLARAEPSLRALRDVHHVALLLSRALAASAAMPAPVIPLAAAAAAVPATTRIAA